MKKIIIFMIFITLTLSSSLLFSQEQEKNTPKSIGRIVKSIGDVIVENNGNSEPIKDGNMVYINDQILTGDKSFAKILMSDNTVFQLGPNSHFTFENFVMTSNDDRKATYNLNYGRLRSIFIPSEKLEPGSLKLKTKSVAMGIRGTEFLTDVYTYKDDLKTDVALITGKLNMNFATTQDAKDLILKPGQLFQSNKIQTPISKLDPVVFQQLKRKNETDSGRFLFNVLHNSRTFPKSEEVQIRVKERIQNQIVPNKIDVKNSEKSDQINLKLKKEKKDVRVPKAIKMPKKNRPPKHEFVKPPLNTEIAPPPPPPPLPPPPTDLNTTVPTDGTIKN